MISLETLADGSVSDRNFQKLMSLVPDTGGQSVRVRFGVATVVWPGGSAASTAAVVTHGLGRTPVAVLATPNSLASTVWAYATVLAIGATTFQIQLAAQIAIAVGNPTPTSWVAIG